MLCSQYMYLREFILIFGKYKLNVPLQLQFHQKWKSFQQELLQKTMVNHKLF